MLLWSKRYAAISKTSLGSITFLFMALLVHSRPIFFVLLVGGMIELVLYEIEAWLILNPLRTFTDYYCWL